MMMTSPPLVHVFGKCSWFGGPSDTGMSDDEGLAFIYEVSEKPELFLPGSTEALGHNLDPDVYFLALRWDYDVTPREMLLTHFAFIRSPTTGMMLPCWPADWGPNSNTGRVCDISKGLMEDLGVETDDDVEVVFPAPFRRSRKEFVA